VDNFHLIFQNEIDIKDSSGDNYQTILSVLASTEILITLRNIFPNDNECNEIRFHLKENPSYSLDDNLSISEHWLIKVYMQHNINLN
jgi:hypothetical protein